MLNIKVFVWIALTVWALAMYHAINISWIYQIGNYFIYHSQVAYEPWDTEFELENKLYNGTLKVVCYYNFPRFLYDLTPEEIPFHLCTHINLAFATITQTNYSIHVGVNDQEIVTRSAVLKQNNKNLKIIISVGGANSNDIFTKLAKYHKTRKMFINSTMKFIKKHKLDGIDIDWEWPMYGNDKIKFVQLLQELKEEFMRHKKKYILSIAAGVTVSIIKMSYYINYIKEYVDYVNLMTYDYHYYTPYYPVTDHNAPLYASLKDSPLLNFYINFSVHYWITQLMPREKIILGLPAFGHTYKLISTLNHDLHALSNGFASIGKDGFIQYNEVCKFLAEQNTFKVFDNYSKVPYAYNFNNWISYDDESSIGIKAAYIIEEHLGGAMIYSLNAEDYNGTCGRDGKKFPLIEKVLSTFNGKGEPSSVGWN